MTTDKLVRVLESREMLCERCSYYADCADEDECVITMAAERLTELCVENEWLHGEHDAT